MTTPKGNLGRGHLLADLDKLVREYQMIGPTTRWAVPIELYVTIGGGVTTPARVADVVVLPRESDAGYLGPGSYVADQDEADRYDGPGPDHDLWPMVIQHLNATGGLLIARWEE